MGGRDKMKERPDCYKCKYRGNLSGNAHSVCKQNPVPIVRGDKHGISRGWFCFPFNFDPVWLDECDGFEQKENHSVEGY